jgi:organic radical activating enzyme
MLYINEIFYSLQGEGARVGYPSIFIRTGLCNFLCQGFNVQYIVNNQIKYGCDSYLAVDSFFKKDWKQYKNHLDIINIIEQQIPKNLKKDSKNKIDIVFTGGEPLLHWGNPIYQKILYFYITKGYQVTIETNGALDIEFTQEYQKNIIFSTSVKLKASGEPQNKRFNLSTLNKIFANTENSFFKFVTSSENWESDIKEINYLLDNIPSCKNIYLMPLGETQNILNRNGRFVFEKAMQLGFKYSDRIHIRIYNDKIGV